MAQAFLHSHSCESCDKNLLFRVNAIVTGSVVMSIFWEDEFRTGFISPASCFKVIHRLLRSRWRIPFPGYYFEPPSVSELCAEMRWAKKIGRKVIRITNVATTFVTGRSRGRVSCEKIQIGRVDCCPAVNVVTITSSKESAKASMPPASSAVPMLGRTT